MQERLGEGILAPPSCQVFKPFREVLVAAARARVAFSSPAMFPMAPEVHAPPPSYLKTAAVPTPPFVRRRREEQYEDAAGRVGAAGDTDESCDGPPTVGGGKGEREGIVAAAGAATGSAVPRSVPGPRPRFKPKKGKTLTTTGGGGDGSGSGREAVIKQEREDDGVVAADGDAGGSAGVGEKRTSLEATNAVLDEQEDSGRKPAEAEGTAAVRRGACSSEDAPEGEGSGIGIEDAPPVVGDGVVRGKGRRGASRPRSNASATVDGENGKPDENAKGLGAGARGGAGAGGGADAGWGRAQRGLTMAKEEPRESSGGLEEGLAARGELVADAVGDAGAAAGGEEEVVAEDGAKKTRSRAKGRAKQEPAPRPKIRPRAATRAKPKGK